MNDETGQQLWEEIVMCTNESDSDCIRSLRIALFFLLSGDCSFPGQARRLVSTARTLVPGKKEFLGAAERGRPLFCFAHQTASNMQNLLPVAREAHRRELLGGIVAFPNFANDLAEFVGHVPIVTPGTLVSQLGLHERIEITREAVATFRKISRMLSEVDSHLATKYHRNAGTAISDI